jgi:hypothetical protein
LSWRLRQAHDDDSGARSTSIDPTKAAALVEASHLRPYGGKSRENEEGGDSSGTFEFWLSKGEAEALIAHKAREAKDSMGSGLRVHRRGLGSDGSGEGPVRESANNICLTWGQIELLDSPQR